MLKIGMEMVFISGGDTTNQFDWGQENGAAIGTLTNENETNCSVEIQGWIVLLAS